MHSASISAWYPFIKRHEGEIAFMYLDSKGLVTTGIGNLIDPVSLALPLPFQFRARNRHNVAAGQMATRQEIAVEWNYLKNHANRSTFIRRGTRAIEPATSLELTETNRQNLFWTKSEANECKLVGHFPQFPEWPADAQLGLMAMAWGLGAGFPPKWPKFSRACKAQDFAAAAADSHVKTWRKERNEASVHLFENAAHVLRNPEAYERATFYYPKALIETLAVS
jgi:GH24 family phage-related lysozyme (muramidase)